MSIRVHIEVKPLNKPVEDTVEPVHALPEEVVAPDPGSPIAEAPKELKESIEVPPLKPFKVKRKYTKKQKKVEKVKKVVKNKKSK